MPRFNRPAGWLCKISSVFSALAMEVLRSIPISGREREKKGKKKKGKKEKAKEQEQEAEKMRQGRGAEQT